MWKIFAIISKKVLHITKSGVILTIMIKYPTKLNTIFEKFEKFDIKPVIVGGFVRDALLGIKSKDIDIEVYNISSYTKLENILKEFGSINIVGKNFGICKLSFDNLQLDFSLPRKDNKVSSGHNGFNVDIDNSLTFKEASSRRDFTINTIGYDPIEKKILDPFNAQKDLKNKILKAVDLKKFGEDPLRVLRGVVFCARFEMVMEKKLKKLCSDMIEKNMLDELAKQRIFEEIKKMLTKAKKPSIGFRLLNELSNNRFQILDITDTITTLKLTQKNLNKLTNTILTNIEKPTCQNELKKELTKITNPPPILQGRHLIELGLKPSKKFGEILDKLYIAQLNKKFNNTKEAKKYLKHYLTNFKNPKG